MYNKMIPIWSRSPFIPCNFVLVPNFMLYEKINSPHTYRGLHNHSYLKSLKRKKVFTTEDAYKIGEKLGIYWMTSPFDVDQYRMGLDVELEHGLIDPLTNVSGDDPIITGKIALAHLNEFPDYYTRLSKMEAQAEKYWENKK